MNTRRKFLISGSVITSALLASKPFSAIAQVTNPLKEMLNQQNSLVLLHTANINESNQDTAIRQIATKRKKAYNSLLLNAGKDAPDNAGELSFDATATFDTDLSLLSNDYRIINKGGIKTGVITAKAGETDLVKKINNLSSFLKKEKNCQMVVCLSQLGYKNKNGMDDMKLAEKSMNVDVIICGHASNFHTRQIIAGNSKKAEVIIHSAAANNSSVGEINICFDEAGQQKSIWFNDPFQVITKN